MSRDREEEAKKEAIGAMKRKMANVEADLKALEAEKARLERPGKKKLRGQEKRTVPT